jgi:GntR family transcriptional regulator/MocR family aminotransferase
MKNRTVFPEIAFDRSAHASSLRKQIERQLAAAIHEGTLPCGSRLPSSRLLARLLKVSRGTVVDAYDALLETGVLVATTGGGTTVAPRSPMVPNFSNLRKTAVAAHFPARVCQFEDWDGNALYLNVVG